MFTVSLVLIDLQKQPKFTSDSNYDAMLTGEAENWEEMSSFTS